MTLGELIRAGRKKEGMSLRQLAAVTGITDVAISQIETGSVKSPAFHRVIRLAKVLNIPLRRAAETDDPYVAKPAE